MNSNWILPTLSSVIAILVVLTTLARWIRRRWITPDLELQVEKHTSTLQPALIRSMNELCENVDALIRAERRKELNELSPQIDAVETALSNPRIAQHRHKILNPKMHRIDLTVKNNSSRQIEGARVTIDDWNPFEVRIKGKFLEEPETGNQLFPNPYDRERLVLILPTLRPSEVLTIRLHGDGYPGIYGSVQITADATTAKVVETTMEPRRGLLAIVGPEIVRAACTFVVFFVLILLAQLIFGIRFTAPTRK
jgi:hypothetical protein